MWEGHSATLVGRSSATGSQTWASSSSGTVGAVDREGRSVVTISSIVGPKHGLFWSRTDSLVNHVCEVLEWWHRPRAEILLDPVHEMSEVGR